MKNVFFLLMVTLLVAGGCKKTPEKNMEGVWLERNIVPKFAGTWHWIRLRADHTFEMKLMLFTDMIDIQPVPCSGNRTDYVKGSYTRSGDRLTLTGSYCNSSFNQPQPNCRGVSDFHIQYPFSFAGEDMIWDYRKEDQDKIWLVRQ